MAIDLTNYEEGASFDGDYSDALKQVQRRLAHIHYAYILHKKRAIIAFEGWDAAGKGGVIKRLTAQWDPRYFEVYPIGAPTADEKDRHFLWRFWTKLPGSSDIVIFDRSWYGRVLVERVENFATEAEWKRGYDEINEFEAQQIDEGTKMIKVFVHVTQDAQDKRFADRLDKPEKRWKITAEDFRNRKKRPEYLRAYADMLKKTDTRWAPWAVIDGNNKKAARIAALTRIADQLEVGVSMDFPDADADLIAMAERAFDYKGKV